MMHFKRYRPSLFWAILLFWSVGLTGLKAQVVTWDPSFPVADGSVTVYFHAAEGTGGLAGYTGDVYAHTGVITDASTGSSDWKYVKTDWGVNTPETKLTRIDTDLYKLDIANIRNYYGVPATEKILKLAFVFRSSDSSLEGKDTGGSDIFIDVYEPGVNVRIADPQDIVFQDPGVDLPITGVGTATGTATLTLTLYIDDQQVASVQNDTLNYTYTPSAEGRHDIMLIGTDGQQNADTASTYMMVKQPVTDQARPAGLKDGITYVNDTTVRLSLFAPYKDFVYVIGDFNNWQADNNYQMNREVVNQDSVYYWIEISGLTPGEEYGFQYLIDGNLRVADPYSEKVLDPNDDQYITDATYPNLKPYPTGKTEFQVGVLQPGKPAFNWQHDDFQRPADQDLVVYELLIRDFVEKHDYATLTDTLDYLDRLGVNAIELMPVMEFEGNLSWGYNPSFHLALDKYYGPEHDMKAFVDSAHARGIAVILDIVLNHAYGQSPLVRMYNEGDYGTPTAQNPWFNTSSPNTSFSFGYDFNHESKATQYFVDRVNQYWLDEYHVDGFRFDFTKGFTNSVGDGWAYDQSRINILERMANQIWTDKPGAYVILEHFAENSEEIELSDYGMMLWGNMNGVYSEAAMGYNANGNSDFSGVYYGTRSWNEPLLVGYMESHDEERLMYKNLNYGNASGSYNIREELTALDRMKLAGAFFFTIPGPKMIWQFGELGYDVSINYNGRTGEKPIRWDYLDDVNRRNLYQTWSALIRLRNSSPLFSDASTTVDLSLASGGKRIVLTNGTESATIIGNFGTTAQTLSPSFTTTGDWYSYFSGDTLNVTNTDMTVDLGPGEFRIYTTQKFETPAEGILTDIDQETNSQLPNRFALHQNYPNPFNPTTQISYDLASATTVRLEIYDILGRKVRTLVDGVRKTAGSYTVRFDASQLSSGLYLARLQAGSRVMTKKMMLLK